MDIFSIIVWSAIVLFLAYKFIRSIRIVPTQKAFIVERLGKYTKTLGPGFHALLPFLDQVTYIQDLKEETIDVPPQECFTLDNVKVEVDGIIYMRILDPVKASYGVTNYRLGAIQLAQTTVRSVIGTIEMDKAFEERDLINSKIVEVLNTVGEAWGVTVNRYEVKNIVPPESVKNAMEKQMTAERERRAVVARAQGDRQSLINNSEGYKEQLINQSEGEKQRLINAAEGHAKEIEAIAEATAQAIEKVASALNEKGGDKAMALNLSQQYLTQLGNLANEDTNVLLPADLMQLNKLLRSLGLKMGE